MSSTFKPQNCLVTISDNLGSVRLRFTYQGIRHNLNLGIPYDSQDLGLAISTAYRIDYDIKHNSFVNKDDYKIKKCKATEKIVTEVISEKVTKAVSDKAQWDLKDILQFYSQHNPNPDSEVLRLRNNLFDWFDRTPQELLLLNNADKWLQFLRCDIVHKGTNHKKGFSDKTIATSLRILKASINFAMSLGKIESNPFVALYRTLDIKNTKDILGYSPEQIQAIIQAFREDTYTHKCSGYKHSYYTDLIEFRFLTGCRPSEVVALTGKDILVKNDRTYINFNKRYVKGVLKLGLKNKRMSRLFPCNESLTNLLSNLSCKGDELLFKGVRGGYVNADTVNRKYWSPVIEGLVIDGVLPYKINFYDQRHVFGSLISRKTIDITTLASIMGNSPSTLYKYYLADDMDFNVPEF